ncbi:MAG: amidohydrolase [Deltaproteobacteria bacterium HGW-Deltaproteobacteria-14]|jgi:imidazolonepropionase-like amidohydrolase|nr:MAG: amidohydrolase [Deltaproteobacteria bacterium HGW-Deltaproteobacteria-14]
MSRAAVQWAAVLALGAAGCVTRPATVDPGATSDPAAPTPLEALEARAHASVEAPDARVGGPFTLEGGTVLTATGERYAPGYVVVEGGRIEALGAGKAPAPKGTVLDVAGRFVTPGLIDVHSHLGVMASPHLRGSDDVNEATAPNTAQVWAEHGFWPQDPGLERAARGGVTTLQALPGSANLIGGRGVTVHLRPARGARAMRFPGAPDGVKMACGENPKRVYGGKGGPSTRMGNIAGHRAAFADAQKWLRDNKGKAAAEVARDLKMETLAAALEGRALVHVHCYRADDMLAFLAAADEFGVAVKAFHHALEAYKIRDILAARHIAVATWADWWGFKLEAYDGIPETLAFVAEAGGDAIVHSDSGEGIQRLNQEAAKALASGRAAGVKLTDDDALRWVTLNPARALGIDGEVGSLEVGKRADLVVWDRDPFSVYARARWVYVDGLRVIDVDASSAPWSDLELGQEVGE